MLCTIEFVFDNQCTCCQTVRCYSLLLFIYFYIVVYITLPIMVNIFTIIGSVD